MLSQQTTQPVQEVCTCEEPMTLLATAQKYKEIFAHPFKEYMHVVNKLLGKFLLAVLV